MPPLHRENTQDLDHPISRHSTTPAIPFQSFDDDPPGALGRPCRLTGPILHQNITTTTAATPQRRAPRQNPAAPDNPVAGCISRQPPTFHVARYILTHGYHHARQGAVDRPALGDDGRYLSAILPFSSSSPTTGVSLLLAATGPSCAMCQAIYSPFMPCHADERWKVVERPTELLPARAFAISVPPPTADKTGWGWALRHFEGDCLAGRTGSRVKRWVWGRGRWEGIYRGVRELAAGRLCYPVSVCCGSSSLAFTSSFISGSCLSNHTSSPS